MKKGEVVSWNNGSRTVPALIVGVNPDGTFGVFGPEGDGGQMVYIASVAASALSA